MTPRRHGSAAMKQAEPMRQLTSSGGAQVNCTSVEISVGASVPSGDGISRASSSRKGKWSAPTAVGIAARIVAPTSRVDGADGVPLGAFGSWVQVAPASPAAVWATRTRNSMLVPCGTIEEKLNCPQYGASMPSQVVPS